MFRKLQNFLFGKLSGNATEYYDGTGNFSTPAGAGAARQITLVIDGGGITITTGIKAFLSVPFSGTITKWRLLSTDAGATAGDIVIDIWKDTYANYPPTNAETITAGNEPELSGVNANEDSTLTGWDTAIAAGDVLGFTVDSATTVTRVSFTLEITP